MGAQRAPHRWPPNHGHEPTIPRGDWIRGARGRMQPRAPPQLGHYLVWAPPARRDPPPHAAAAQPPSRNDAVGNGSPARAFFCRGKRPASSPRRRVRPFRCVVGFQNFFFINPPSSCSGVARSGTALLVPCPPRFHGRSARIPPPRVHSDSFPTLGSHGRSTQHFVYTDELLLVSFLV